MSIQKTTCNKIYISSDHAGFEMKNITVSFLSEQEVSIVDLGPDVLDPSDDYPDSAMAVARAVIAEPQSCGIIIGGSGQGEAIAANRFKGIRAVVFNGQYRPEDGRDVPDEIVLSRQHNDSNVLCLGARFLNQSEVEGAVLKWLQTDFSGDERHIRRIKKIDELIS